MWLSEKKSKTTHLLAMAFFALCFLACSARQEPQQAHEEWLSYEPAEIVLKGELNLIEKFGPPNFGESPQTDKKEKIWVLKLQEAIQIKGDPDSAINQASLTGIQEVQIICSESCTEKFSKLARLQDKKISVTGTLSQAISAHHYTPVILDLKSISEAKNASTNDLGKDKKQKISVNAEHARALSVVTI